MYWIKKNEISDAHVHFNMKKNDVVEDLVRYLKENNLRKMVIIINTKEEFDNFHKNYEILEEYTNQIEVVFGFDIHNQFWREGLNYCKKNNKSFNIKIHPRLFQITEVEIEHYIKGVEEMSPNLIIVDDFLYGDSVEEDISLKIICEIAKRNSKIPIIMAHAGGVNLLRHVMQTKTYANVYYDISLTGNYLSNSSIEQDVEWLVKYLPHRVLLGSDYPDFTIQQAKCAIYKYAKKSKLPKEKLLQIMYKNVDKLYGGDNIENGH